MSVRGRELVAPNEWDVTKDTYAANIGDFVWANPDDPDASAMLARIRPWQKNYLKWRRGTLGFGF